MEFIELVKARYTERKYNGQAVGNQEIQKILEAGRLAPTAKNNQPQKIYIAQSQEAMDKIRSVTPCHYGASTAMIICYDREKEWQNPSETGVTSGIEDVSIIATHMMLAATEQGISTTWVNMFSPSEVKKVFGLPENEIPVLLMMLGYPEKKETPSVLHAQRKPLSETVAFI